MMDKEIKAGGFDTVKVEAVLRGYLETKKDYLSYALKDLWDVISKEDYFESDLREKAEEVMLLAKTIADYEREDVWKAIQPRLELCESVYDR